MIAVPAVLSLASLGLFGVRYLRNQRDFESSLLVVGTGTALVAFYFWLLLGPLANYAFFRGLHKIHVEPGCLYVERLLYLTQSVWGLWCVALVSALLLLLFLSLRGNQLARAARAATCIVVLQSTLWLMLLSVFASPLFGTWNLRGVVHKLNVERIDTCFAETTVAFYYYPTSIFLALTTAAILITSLLRFLIARLPFLALSARDKIMPRLLLGSGIVTAVLWSGALYVAFFILAYLDAFGENNVLFQWLKGSPTTLLPPLIKFAEDNYLATLLIGGASVALSIVGLSSGVHIARDLIDHQFEVQDTSGRVKPRRQRIRDRLSTVAREIVQPDRPDALVFVAHSQGSVIVLDYLLQPSAECATLLNLRPHIVTFGSPIQHLYQHYFDEYGKLSVQINNLSERLSSWTNLYRVDDYIGRHIESQKFIKNELMAPGGHTNYWFEKRLMEIILGAIVGNAYSSAEGAQ